MVASRHSVEKRKNSSQSHLTGKIFREIDMQCNLVLNVLISRNFCEKMARVKYRNLYTVMRVMLRHKLSPPLVVCEHQPKLCDLITNNTEHLVNFGTKHCCTANTNDFSVKLYFCRWWCRQTRKKRVFSRWIPMGNNFWCRNSKITLSTEHLLICPSVLCKTPSNIPLDVIGLF